MQLKDRSSLEDLVIAENNLKRFIIAIAVGLFGLIPAPSPSPPHRITAR